MLKTAEFPSSINLSLDYFTAAAYLPVALLLCGSNCCLALRWNASENRFFPLNCLPQNCLYKNPLQLSLVHQLQWFATPTILCLYHRGEKIAGTKVHELNFTGSYYTPQTGKTDYQGWLLIFFRCDRVLENLRWLFPNTKSSMSSSNRMSHIALARRSIWFWDLCFHISSDWLVRDM